MKHVEALVFVVALLAKRPEANTVLIHFNERTTVCETYAVQPYWQALGLAVGKGAKHDT